MTMCQGQDFVLVQVFSEADAKVGSDKQEIYRADACEG